MQLAMVGLGRMGANMVKRLATHGHACVVFDVSPKAVEELAKENNVVGSSSIEDMVVIQRVERPPAELISKADAVCRQALESTAYAGDRALIGHSGNLCHRSGLRTTVKRPNDRHREASGECQAGLGQVHVEYDT